MFMAQIIVCIILSNERLTIKSPTSRQWRNVNSLLTLAHSGEGGGWPLSVINYGRFIHPFCTASVVEVLNSLENCLLNKIIRSLLSCVTKLHVSQSSCKLVASGGRGACHFVSLTTADLIILFAQYQLWKSQKQWKTEQHHVCVHKIILWCVKSCCRSSTVFTQLIQCPFCRLHAVGRS